MLQGPAIAEMPLSASDLKGFFSSALHMLFMHKN